ncbi:uncharacterized protein RJT21DRAFT_121209, partial [Scheffersomyces amazonensis]|uniref:uncharacterized protein n=1 Tax=Scheffersomyces amazonensis TaxID=1078765 RepID=UPI00315D08EF
MLVCLCFIAISKYLWRIERMSNFIFLNANRIAFCIRIVSQIHIYMCVITLHIGISIRTYNLENIPMASWNGFYFCNFFMGNGCIWKLGHHINFLITYII